MEKNLERFLREEFMPSLNEGNPLSRMYSNPRHSIIMSAARKDLSPKENKARMENLYDDLKSAGATFKKTKGVWQNATGEVENEDSVMAHLPDDEDGSKIVSLGHKLRKKHNQDAFIHRKPDGSGTAHNRDGSSDVYGKRTASNVNNPYGETQFRPTRPSSKRPKFTFTDEEPSKSKRGNFKKLK